MQQIKSASKTLYHVSAFLIISIWGVTFVSTKVLLNNGLTPVDIMLYRFAIAYVLLCLLEHRRLWANSIKDELLFIASGITGGSLYFVTENIAIDYTLASNVSIILCTAPILTALLSRVFIRGERIKRSLVWGSVVALAGVVLVVFNGSIILQINPIGDLLTLAAAACWAFYTIILKKLDSYPTVFITRKVFFYGLVTLLPMFYFYPLHWNAELFSLPQVWGNLLFLGIIASFICFIAWNKTVKVLGGIRANNYIYLTPLVTLVASAIVLHERITFVAIGGALLIICGVYVAEKGFPKFKKRAPR